MSPGDFLAEVLETLFRLFPVRARTGVRVLGKPGPESPVFLTGNYDLTVRRVMRALSGIDGYLVVADSHGINVWCAASGGHLGTHQVVTAMKLAQLESRVVHRELIVPQLAATGVQGREVRRRTGWIVRFGPADARDIRDYLAAGKDKTPALRRVKFSARARIEMAVAWAAPISLVGAAIFRRHWLGVVAMVWALAYAVFFAFDRLPGGERVRQAVTALAAIGVVNAALALLGGAGAVSHLGWSLGALATAGLLTFDFAGSTPIAPAGMFEEKNFRIALDRERCRGAWNCWAVCPEAVFEKEPELHKVAIAHADRCIRCGACVVQCPQDALAFETAEGRRIEPELIRRFKLNLLGKRAVPSKSADIRGEEADRN